MIEKIKKWILEYAVIIKYSFATLLTFFTYSTTADLTFVGIGIIELTLIFIISNLLIKFNKILGNVLNSMLMLFYNIEQIVLFFSGSYVTLIMVTNIASIKALLGNFGIYLVFVIPTLLITFLPIRKANIDYRIQLMIIATFLFLEIFIVTTNRVTDSNSPLINYFKIANEQIEQLKIIQKRRSGKNVTADFYNSRLDDSYSKPSKLSKRPNVVLIFTEGLSKEIIDDSRDLMPNLKKFESQSLNFTSYYNHTFATYRGLIGQLYSGYQFQNTDNNTLVSIQSILGNLGYKTSIINTEPNNEMFQNYLLRLGFSEVNYKKVNHDGTGDTMSDKSAYQFLFEEIKKSSKAEQPFFTAIYTFGTHLSLDSPDKIYKSGDNSELNKFYNLDYQFGKFLKKFNNSQFTDDTILIFTTDHAKFVDDAYWKSFPDSSRARGNLDEIPLFIYYKGISPQVIDVGGRNSLDLAPTVLDYLDISAPNYFLGTSLFTKMPRNQFSYTFNSLSDFMTTQDGHIDFLSEEDKDTISDKITSYFKANQQKMMTP